MAITDIPLRIKNSNGDLQQFSTSEENYIAYQMGLNLAARTKSSGSALTDNGGSNTTNIGSFIDTRYNQIGASGDNGTIVELEQTTSFLHQRTNEELINGTNYETPIGYKTSDTSIREMVDSDLFTLVDRTLSVWVANDYPGIYKLDSSGFSDPDYSIHIDTVFEDNRNDLQTDYHIWKRSSMTAPTAARPMFVVRTEEGGYGGGVREMTDAQIQYTFGQRARNRITETGIGTYQLRDNTQGAPTAPGTWVAKGVATDTRNVIVDTQFSDTYEATFGLQYSSQVDNAYTGNYQKEYGQQYSNQYTGQYTKQYAGIRQFSNTTQYLGSFAGTVGYSVGAQYTEQYTGQYTRQYGGQYSGQYTGTRSFAGTAQFTGQYAGFIIGPSFTGNYTRQYTGTFGGGSYTGTFGGGSYTGTYVKLSGYGGAYVNNGDFEVYAGIYFNENSYTGTFTGSSYTGTFTGSSYTGQFSRTYSGTYVLDVENQYSGTYERSVQYSGQRTFTGTFAGQFSRNYAGQFSRQYTGGVTYTGTRQYAGQYTGTINYAGTRNFSQQYSRQYTQQYTTQYATIYEGTYTGQYGGIYGSAYAGGQYTAQYAGEIVDDTQSTVIKTYTLYVRIA